MIDKIFKIIFAFCLFSCGFLALIYAFVIFWSAVIAPFFAPPMPYCDEIDISKPRPVGYRYYCKGREKTPTALKSRGIIRNGILLEFGQ